VEFSNKQLSAVARQIQPAVVEFASRMISVTSMPGYEDKVAAIVTKEMKDLAFNEVWVDRAGNVIGKINGNGGPSVLLNGHMDHVDAGSQNGWPYPPFAAKIVNGELWGRGAVDMKGPVACMIYAATMFQRLGITPPGDIYVTVAVMEEIGGLGTRHLATHLTADAAICGEPSNNTLRRGHRGRVELIVELKGRSAHASIPHLAVNPHYGAAMFLQELDSLSMAYDETLGYSTVVPTLYQTDQFSPNVIPETIRLTLDWRNVPTESADEIVAKIQNLLSESLPKVHQPDLIQGRVFVNRSEFTTYTGMVEVFPSIFPSFILPEDDLLVLAAHHGLVRALQRDVAIDIWRFATDGGHLMSAGIPTLGFGPGDDQLAHTNQERISLAQMEEALVGYLSLMLALADALEAKR
jgi:putative selenium metabolism hydrolase